MAQNLHLRTLLVALNWFARLEQPKRTKQATSDAFKTKNLTYLDY